MLHPALQIKKADGKGWGVFTTEHLAEGTLLEVSPVIIMTANEFETLNQTRLHDYIFHWEDDKCCMAMGYVPVYNHAVPSNCEYFQDYENGVIEIKTVQIIEKETELTINYQGDPGNTEKVWFDVLG